MKLLIKVIIIKMDYLTPEIRLIVPLHNSLDIHLNSCTSTNKCLIYSNETTANKCQQVILYLVFISIFFLINPIFVTICQETFSNLCVDNARGM